MSTTTPTQHIFHLLPNAHLDPVWLWDWREGLNEGIITVRTVLDLMDEIPELTFMRGESAIYRYIQKNDPATFRRIRKRIDQGRWEVIGGTVIQPDTNLTSAEVLCREFEIALEYFQRELGVRPRVAWQADSFGHSQGMLPIFAAFGVEGFAFTRPQRNAFPMVEPAFWWRDGHGHQTLCYRPVSEWYGAERAKFNESLDRTLAGTKDLGLVNVGVTFGLGNHGGGPTRQHVQDIERWRQEHPEIEVRYSTLHGFFQALKKELEGRPDAAPAVTGELPFCLRGCYSSVQRFKSLFRRAESMVAEAEITRSIVGTSTGLPIENLSEAWDALAFNAFHDILPGSSIERAYDEQTAWMGLALHRAEEARFAALNQLAARIDTTVPPPRRPDAPTDVAFVIWNSLPRPFVGMIEAECSLDYRPLWQFVPNADAVPLVVYGADGKAVPFQSVPTEHTSMPTLPWRKRFLVPVTIPALGWTTLRAGWRDEEQPRPAFGECRATPGENTSITNGLLQVSVRDGAIEVQKGGRNFFTGTGGVELRVVEDPWGSWGGMAEEKEALNLETLREKWVVDRSEVLESGPLRAKLWVRLKGKNSWITLTLAVTHSSPVIMVESRLLWNERSARLKLILPCRGEAQYEVPGARVTRDEKGQVPGGKWVTRGGLGFACESFSDFDASEDELRVTLARASRYANDVPTGPDDQPWQPAVDCGEFKFKFALFGEESSPEAVADLLQFPPTSCIAPPAKGDWKRQGSLGALTPSTVKLLTLEQLSKTRLRVRVQNWNDAPTSPVLTMGKTRVKLGKLRPFEIANFSLLRTRDGTWQAARQGGKAGSSGK